MEEKKTFFNNIKDFFKKFGKKIVSILLFILGGVATALGIKKKLDKKQISKNEETIIKNENIKEKAKEVQKDAEEVIKKNEEIIEKYSKKN